MNWCIIDALPLQDDASHILDSKLVAPASEQCSPPYFGAGLLQGLVLVRIPMLHEVEHSPQFCQLLHPP